MPFANIQFQEVSVECLRKSIRENRLAHAWLLCGPEGTGKSLAALSVCEALFCMESPQEGCGHCVTCRRIQKRTHADVSWLASERSQLERGWIEPKALSKQPSQEIHIEQIRQLQERLHIRALEGKHKAAIILNAHEMNIQAQNALLKTLEEPPADTVLLLCTHKKEGLLPTLQSRCQVLAFKPLPSAFVAERLVASGIEPVKAERLAELSEGSLGRAQRLGEGWLEFQEKTEAEFFSLEAKAVGGLLAFAERHGSSRAVAEQCLDALLSALSRRVKALAKEGEAPPREVLHWLYKHERAEQAKAAIVQRNGAPRLQMEAMLLEMFSEPAGV